MLPAAVVCVFAAFAQAQNKSQVDARITAGSRVAVVEPTCSGGGGQLMGGGSVQYYFTAQSSIGPEILFVRSCERQTFTFYHPHLSAMMYVATDLSQSVRIRPYLIGGVGVVRHHSRFASPNYKVEVAGGAGSKVFIRRRMFVSPEAQVGAPVLFVRFTASIGFVLR